MNYTKGERSTNQTTKGHWSVTIGGGLHTPRTTIGQFIKREDALLDVAAPELYEALRALIKQFRTIEKLYSKDLDIIEQGEQAIAKAGGNEGRR